MKLEPSHRVKTFGLAVVVLLSTIAAGGTWLDGSVPLDRVGGSVENPLANAEASVFVQSGGLVPDGVDDTASGEGDVRQAAAPNARAITVR